MHAPSLNGSLVGCLLVLRSNYHVLSTTFAPANVPSAQLGAEIKHSTQLLALKEMQMKTVEDASHPLGWL